MAEFRAKGYLPEALVNYLALLGWSPGEGQELLPLDQLAARFELGAVGHSAGVFDEAKLAWVNRHYLKLATAERLVSLSLPYLERAGWITGAPSVALSAWLAGVVPPLATSIDKLSDLPDRLRRLFEWDPVAALARPDVGAEARDPLAVSVARAFAAAVAAGPALTTKDAFRALARQVGAATGAKGKALFHTLRLVCTGEPDGPELDILIPAIDQAASLTPADGLVPVMSCRARAAAFVAALSRDGEASWQPDRRTAAPDDE